MRVHILGTCSGTEPMPGRRHASVAVEARGGLYWFDAGEGCSHTAHVTGLDLLSIRQVVISHPHMDHVGGLGNLLWNIRKLRYRRQREVGRDIGVWIPNKHTYDGVMGILWQTEGGFESDFGTPYRPVRDGELFCDDGVRVTARHNLHMGEAKDGQWQSFSFLIECEGKKIAYTGDLGAVSELDAWRACDLLLAETGHHAPEAVARRLLEIGFEGTLAYTHHGRQMLYDPAAQRRLAEDIYPGRIIIANDGQMLDAGVDF